MSVFQTLWPAADSLVRIWVGQATLLEQLSTEHALRQRYPQDLSGPGRSLLDCHAYQAGLHAALPSVQKSFQDAGPLGTNIECLMWMRLNGRS